MPLYDFQCPKCRYVASDLMVRLSNFRDPQQCPRCGDHMERLPSAPSFKVEGFNAANGYTTKQQ